LRLPDGLKILGLMKTRLIAPPPLPELGSRRILGMVAGVSGKAATLNEKNMAGHVHSRTQKSLIDNCLS